MSENPHRIQDLIPHCFFEEAASMLQVRRNEFASRNLVEATCMQNARVFIIEDYDKYRDTLLDWLTSQNHIVVGTASNRRDALDAIDRFEELGVQVVTVDGNLGRLSTDNKDGRLVIDEIKKRYPHVITIGLSDDSLSNADYDLGKDYKTSGVARFISNNL